MAQYFPHQVREAVEILSDVERGIITFNEQTKKACRLGREALLSRLIEHEKKFEKQSDRNALSEFI